MLPRWSHYGLKSPLLSLALSFLLNTPLNATEFDALPVEQSYSEPSSPLPDRWWESAVFYQIYTRSFADANGDGIGDLRGIIAKLDYIQSLGVQAIWLSPLHPSPNADYGYDVSNYYEVHPQFGTMQDFEELIAECTLRKIAVVMDLVVNHTSDQHPWFIASKDPARNNPMRDWYIWKKPKNKPNGLPTNWFSRFGLGQTAWTWSNEGKGYYLHSFLPSQPDLNWRNPEVRAEIRKVMEFWLKKGVKGFRLDVCNYYVKDNEFRDNPVLSSWEIMNSGSRSTSRSWVRWIGQLGQSFMYPYGAQLHLYDKDQDEVLDVLREFRQTVAPYNAVLLGEVDSDDDPAAKAAKHYGPQADALHLAFNNQMLDIPWSAAEFYQTFSRWQQILPKGGWPTITFSNHDKKRAISRYGNDALKAKILFTLEMTMRGSPIIYYGEEIGMEEVKIPEIDIKDPAYFAFKMGGPLSWFSWPGRDGCRTPMQWSKAQYGGFSLGYDLRQFWPLPWLIARNANLTKNVESQDDSKAPHSFLNTFRSLIALRNASPALTKGEVNFIKSGISTDVLAYTRTYSGEQGEQELLILLNFAPSIRSISLPIGGNWEVMWDSRPDSFGVLRSTTFALQPLEAVILRKR